MTILNGKYPLKFYVFLAMSIIAIVFIPFADLVNESSTLKIILVVALPALFFSFCIDSAPKLRVAKISKDSIYINVIMWHSLKYEKVNIQRENIKAIKLGSNGYTIVIDTKYGDLVFDARYLIKKDRITTRFLTPREVLSLFERDN